MWTALIGAFTWFMSSSWPKILAIVLTTFFVTSYGVSVTMIYSPSYRLWIWKKTVEIESKDDTEEGKKRRLRLLSEVNKLQER